MAVTDREALEDLGVQSGSFVVVRGRDDGTAVARVWPSDAEDAGRGYSHIDGQLRSAANVGVDEPDEDARREILAIHTRDTPLGDDVDLDDLAARTEGYVGADVEAVCREGSQIAVREYVHAVHEGDDPDLEDVVVTGDHFEEALEPVDPTHGDGAVAESAQAAGLG